ncbi:MAG: hemolysin family protein [Candidatus Omnitrophota bacterium]|nr:hemolysin family protein [Candidatus Omnitrophota bacterium]
MKGVPSTGMITLYTILILSAIMMQAFFTASEMAFTSVSRIKLKNLLESGDPHAKKLDRFLKKEGLYLGTTLVGTNIAIVISSALATRIFAEYFGSAVSPVITTVVMVPVTLVFAEIVPKMIARQFSVAIALKAVNPLRGFHGIFMPVIGAVNAIARVFLMPFGKGATMRDLTFTKSDLKRMLLMGREAGEVEADEVELIHKVLDLGAKKVEKIMIPLYRVSSISVEDSVENLKRLVTLTGFSRIPVYKKNKNNISGIINIYDILFKTEDKDNKAAIDEFMREPVYVKRSDGLDIALARLRHQEQPMGIVADNDDNVVGIVTIEDILEEIVGEIEDRG